MKKEVGPIFSINLSAETIEPGHCIRVRLESDQMMQADLKTQEISTKMQPLETDGRFIYEAFFSIPLDTQPDVYGVTITAIDQHENKHFNYLEYTIIPRSPFKISHLWIKSFGKYDFESESALMRKAREASSDYAMFQVIEPFEWPVQGRVSEFFGVKRIYNGGKNSWYHGGLDIAAPGGTEIVAPADGVVLITQPFEAHGNTTLIYHGFGIVTTFLHQREILVKPGQHVKRGDVIGRVGSTGSSTGNHLHFQINIHHILVDPYDFLQKDNL